MKTVRNSLNYAETEESFEFNTLPSLTIPDETMSLREILDRYARGLPISGNEPIYHVDDDGNPQHVPDFNHMDFADVQTYRENLRQAIDETRQNAINQHKDFIRRTAELDKLDKQFREEIAEWKLEKAKRNETSDTENK